MIAGPYRSGASTQFEFESNLDRLNRAALAIFQKGHVPIIGVNLALPVIRVAGPERYDELMMPLSLAVARRCDGVLRVPGASSGADLEVECIRSHGGVVYLSEDEIPEVDRRG